MLTTTIRRKLIFYFVVPILGMGLLYFAISRYYTQREFLRTIEERAVNDSLLIADRIKDASLTNDRIPLTALVLNEKYSNPSISYITVFSATGEVIAHGNLDAIPGNIFSDPSDTALTARYVPYKNITVYNIDRPLFSGIYKIGMVRIGFDLNAVLATFNYTTYLFIGLGIFFLAGITLFVIKLSNAITQPIGTLKEAVIQFTQGNITSRAQVYASDEIGELAKAFNAMADALTSSKELLEKEKQALEGKIQELEKWQETTVGRELKMMELKKMVERLEKK